MSHLLLSEIFPPKTGGSGRWFYEVYRRLPRQDYVIAAGEDPRHEAFDQTHDLRLVRMPLTLKNWGFCSWEGSTGYWRAVKQLGRLVRKEHVQMIHCGRCLPEGVMALALRWWLGIPYLCYVHGEEMNYASASRELSWLAKRVLRGAAFVIANSRNTRSILTQDWRLPPEKIHALHPGVDIERFVPAARNPAARAQLGWDDRPVVLTVGRLQKRKGHDMMIRALESVRKAIPDVLYAIVGDGEERLALEALVAETGLQKHVQFLGEIEDTTLVSCYQQCDLFVLPNRQVGQDIEGFGMVLVEAQACGKPVVAGTSGGTAETMQIPETGCVVDCTTPAQLVPVLTEWLSNPMRLAEMGKAGLAWAVNQFDWSSLTDRAGKLFRDSCASRWGRLPRRRFVRLIQA